MTDFLASRQSPTSVETSPHLASTHYLKSFFICRKSRGQRRKKTDILIYRTDISFFIFMVNKSSCSFSHRVWRKRRMTVCCSCRDTASGICSGKKFQFGKHYLPWNVEIHLDNSNSKYLCTFVAAHVCSLAVSTGSWDAGHEQA